MGYASPSFPAQVWDGLSPNPVRTSREVDHWCNQDDWDQLVAEMIAVQETILNTPDIAGVERISLYSAEADQEITGGKLIRVQTDGTVILATSTIGLVSGIALVTITTGQLLVYLRRGRINSNDWSVTTGSESLIPGYEYYLGLDGMMSETPPETGYLVSLGQAQSTTAFDLSIHQSIRL